MEGTRFALKGVVFNLLEHVVSEEAGETAWERAPGGGSTFRFVLPELGDEVPGL